MATKTNPQDTQLKTLGFRIDTKARRTQAIRDLQTALAVSSDGSWGPITQAAVDKLAAANWKIRPSFHLKEFACKCGGKFADCRRIVVTPALLDLAQAIRDRFYPQGLLVVSGYRCPAHNRAVGGAPASYHVKGMAIDVPNRISPAQARQAGAKGIGFGSRTGRVNHVDARPGQVVQFIDGK